MSTPSTSGRPVEAVSPGRGHGLDEEPAGRPRWVVLLLWAAVASLLTVAAATSLGAGGDLLVASGIYNLTGVLIVALCFARAGLVREHRLAWVLFGIALSSWVLGDIYWTLFLTDESSYPSLADAFFLGFFPFAFAGLVALSGLDSLRRSFLDAAIAALGGAAILAAILVPRVAELGGDAAAVATNFSYPVGDIVLLAALLACGLFSASAVGRTWLLLAAGLGLFITADSIFLLEVAAGTYAEGGWLDLGWLLGMLLIGLAAWQPASRAGAPSRRHAALTAALPAGFALLAVALLLVDHYHGLNGTAVDLAALTLILGALRLGMVFIENEELLRRATQGEKRYRTLVETAAEAVVTVDRGGNYTFVNDRFTELSGYTAGEVLGRSVLDLLVDGDEKTNLAQRLAAGDEYRPTVIDLEGRHKDGHAVWLHANASPLFDDAGEKTGWLSMFSDVTARHVAEQDLRESEERFRIAFEAAPVGIALAAIEGGANGRYQRVNDSYCRLVGYSEAELLRTGPDALIHPDDRDAERNALAALLAGETRSYRIEHRLLHASGMSLEVIKTCSLVRDADGEPLYTIRQVADISERKRFERELEDLVNHDGMTGLLSRRRLHEELERELAAADRHGEAGVLLMFDLDGFKEINDNYGHEAGDEALIAITRAVSARLRRTDSFGRLGGDEFVIVLPRIGLDDAATVAGELLRTVRETVLAAGDGGARLTASIGLAGFSGADLETSDEVVARADRAMYAAKEDGRDRFAVYETGLDRVADADRG